MAISCIISFVGVLSHNYQASYRCLRFPTSRFSVFRGDSAGWLFSLSFGLPARTRAGTGFVQIPAVNSDCQTVLDVAKAAVKTRGNLPDERHETVTYRLTIRFIAAQICEQIFLLLQQSRHNNE